MLITAATFVLLLPAYMISRYVVRNARLKLALKLFVALAAASAMLAPDGVRVAPWRFEPDSQEELAFYLLSELAFFTMMGIGAFLAQRIRNRRA